MAEHTFKTTDSGKEYPARFAGMEFRYNVPEAVEGNMEATLENIQAVIDPNADLATVLMAKFLGQGYHLDWQKELKSFLGREETPEGSDVPVSIHRDRTEEEVYEAAVAHMAEWKVGEPRTRSAGGSKRGKVAKAEARAEKAENATVTLYRTLNKAQRKAVRSTIADAEILALFDSIDAEGDAA